MKLPPLLVHAAVLVGAALVAAYASAAEQPDARRFKELVHIVRQDCGSCHGLTLAGGLGPALTPAALAGKPVDGLVATVYAGRPGTPMPPFRGVVSEAEAAWIVDQLVRGFPADGGAASARAD